MVEETETVKFRVEEVMPDKVTVTAKSPIPLWYGDENGIAKIPCTRRNPVKYGIGFQVLVADSEFCMIATPHVDSPDKRVIPFSNTISDARCPATKGLYTGNVTVDGRAGTIHVVIINYPKPTPKCDIRNARAEPAVVKPGGNVNIVCDVCNVGGGVMDAEIRKTFTGPTPILPITEKVPGVRAGACVHHRETVKIPTSARGGEYTCTLMCSPGGIRPVEVRFGRR